jgi:hypothetical protein
MYGGADAVIAAALLQKRWKAISAVVGGLEAAMVSCQ